MLKIAFPKYKISKFPGEKCPRRLSLGKLFLSNALSLNSTAQGLVL